MPHLQIGGGFETGGGKEEGDVKEGGKEGIIKEISRLFSFS